MSCDGVHQDSTLKRGEAGPSGFVFHFLAGSCVRRGPGWRQRTAPRLARFVDLARSSYLLTSPAFLGSSLRRAAFSAFISTRSFASVWTRSVSRSVAASIRSLTVWALVGSPLTNAMPICRMSLVICESLYPVCRERLAMVEAVPGSTLQDRTMDRLRFFQAIRKLHSAAFAAVVNMITRCLQLVKPERRRGRRGDRPAG